MKTEEIKFVIRYPLGWTEEEGSCYDCGTHPEDLHTITKAKAMEIIEANGLQVMYNERDGKVWSTPDFYERWQNYFSVQAIAGHCEYTVRDKIRELKAVIKKTKDMHEALANRIEVAADNAAKAAAKEEREYFEDRIDTMVRKALAEYEASIIKAHKEENKYFESKIDAMVAKAVAAYQASIIKAQEEEMKHYGRKIDAMVRKAVAGYEASSRKTMEQEREYFEKKIAALNQRTETA